MKTKSNIEFLVRTRHRVSQWVPLLNLVAFGLALTLGLVWLVHPSAAPVTRWQRLSPAWLAGLVLTGAAAVALWRARRRSLVGSAAEIDSAMATHNRLEAATALQGADDALARAQRAETEQYLHQSRIAPRRGWLAVSITLVTLLAAAHVATLACWTRPLHVVAKAKANAPVAAEHKAAPAAPAASIEWRSPESETSATAIEEVPLEALADSSTGLRNLVLEVEVNGKACLAKYALNQRMPS